MRFQIDYLLTKHGRQTYRKRRIKAESPAASVRAFLAPFYAVDDVFSQSVAVPDLRITEEDSMEFVLEGRVPRACGRAAVWTELGVIVSHIFVGPAEQDDISARNLLSVHPHLLAVAA